MIRSVHMNNSLYFYNHLADGLSAGQTVVCFADVFELKSRFIKQWLKCACIHNLGQLRQNNAMFFSLVVVQHWNQHEDNVQRQTFEVRGCQIQLQQGHCCGDLSIQCGRFKGVCDIGSTNRVENDVEADAGDAAGCADEASIDNFVTEPESLGLDAVWTKGN